MPVADRRLLLPRVHPAPALAEEVQAGFIGCVGSAGGSSGPAGGPDDVWIRRPLLVLVGVTDRVVIRHRHSMPDIDPRLCRRAYGLHPSPRACRGVHRVGALTPHEGQPVLKHRGGRSRSRRPTTAPASSGTALPPAAPVAAPPTTSPQTRPPRCVHRSRRLPPVVRLLTVALGRRRSPGCVQNSLKRPRFSAGPVRVAALG